MKDTELYIVGALFYVCSAIYEGNGNIASAKMYNLIGMACFLLPIIFHFFRK